MICGYSSAAPGKRAFRKPAGCSFPRFTVEIAGKLCYNGSMEHMALNFGVLDELL